MDPITGGFISRKKKVRIMQPLPASIHAGPPGFFSCFPCPTDADYGHVPRQAIKVAVSTRAQHSLVFDFKTASNACMCNKKRYAGNGQRGVKSADCH
jgi:hypothetical protein